MESQNDGGTRPIIRLIGPVGVETHQLLHVAPGPFASTCLALLATSTVPIDADALVDKLWGDPAPASARASLRNHISRLNKLLRQHGVEPATSREGVGYEMPGGSLPIDIDLVQSAVDAAREVQARDPRQALDHVRSVARFSSSEPLGGVRGCADLDRLERRIAQLLADARELEIELRVSLGETTSVLPLLIDEVDRQPYNDRIAGHYLMALHRSGRTIDALRAYQDHRRRLIDDLGIEPSNELRLLESKIVSGETLETTPAPSSPSTPKLPSNDVSVGRRSEIETIVAAVADQRRRCVIVSGDAGIGKSHVVTEVLHRFLTTHEVALVWADPDGESYQAWRQLARQWSGLRACRDSAERFLRLSASQSTNLSHQADLYDAALELVNAATGEQPALVVIEDAHAADSASLALGRRLVRECDRLSLVVTSRSRSSDLDHLAALGTTPLVLQLGPLDSDAIAELVIARLDVNPGRARRISQRLLERTGGHPCS
ncbi:MAG: BTAD domain-containing putative transcriptional regulator [Acidimicrobiales bacterium]